MAPCLSVNRSRESRPGQRRKLIIARSEFAGSLSYSGRSVAYSADPGNPPDLGLALARETTMKNIRQNLLLAFGYNFFAIPIAAGALYPVLGWTLSPMLAAAAMSLSSISVIGNAL